jgi:hypothetical protein
MMARVSIKRTWPTGDAVKVSIDFHNCYPDALDQARAEAKRALADACDVVLTEDDEPDSLPALPAEVVLPERTDRTHDED